MKKMKLLMPLLGVAATAGAVLPAAVSCGNGGGQEEKAEIKITEPTKKTVNTVDVKEPKQGITYCTVATFEGFSVTGVESLDELKLEVDSDAWLAKEFVEYSSAELVKVDTPANEDGINFNIVLKAWDDQWLPADTFQLFMAIYKDNKPIWVSADYHVNVVPTIVEPTTKEGQFSDDEYTFEGFDIGHFDAGIFDNYIPILIDTNGVDDWTNPENWLNDPTGQTTTNVTASFEGSSALGYGELTITNIEWEGDLSFCLALVSFNELTEEIDGIALTPSNNSVYTVAEEV